MEFIRLLQQLTNITTLDFIWKTPHHRGGSLPFPDMRHQSSFCHKIKANPNQLPLCVHDCSDRLHFFRESDIAYQKKCHAGGHLIYVPFCVEKNYLGTLVIGPFSLRVKDTLLPYIELDKINQISEMIEMMKPIIIKEILNQFPILQDKDHDPIQKCLVYCRNHLHEEITIESLASECHLSPSRLMHLCKEKTGRTIIELLIEMRIQKACTLLESTNFKIKDIALLSGFFNHNYFNLKFKTLMGQTPKEYRSKNHNINEP